MKYGSDTWCAVCCQVAWWVLGESGRDFGNLHDVGWQWSLRAKWQPGQPLQAYCNGTSDLVMEPMRVLLQWAYIRKSVVWFALLRTHIKLVRTTNLLESKNSVKVRLLYQVIEYSTHKRVVRAGSQSRLMTFSEMGIFSRITSPDENSHETSWDQVSWDQSHEISLLLVPM